MDGAVDMDGTAMVLAAVRPGAWEMGWDGGGKPVGREPPS
jgi:hypothetical protein